MTDIQTALKLAMDYDQEGKWDKAHETVQDLKHEMAFRIHAYLHRKEGDIINANYWYQLVGLESCNDSFESERNNILRCLKGAPQ